MFLWMYSVHYYVCVLLYDARTHFIVHLPFMMLYSMGNMYRQRSSRIASCVFAIVRVFTIWLECGELNARCMDLDIMIDNLYFRIMFELFF